MAGDVLSGLVSVPPESVAVRPPAGPLVAGRPVTLSCQVTGSEPAARVNWLVGSTEAAADRHQQQPSPDGNGTVSLLSFTPEPADHGQTVTCRAANPAAGTPPAEDALILHVQCEYT